MLEEVIESIGGGVEILKSGKIFEELDSWSDIKGGGGEMSNVGRIKEELSGGWYQLLGAEVKYWLLVKLGRH